MNIIETPEMACPKCDAQINAAMAIDGTDVPPVEGDISICACCAAPLQFNADLTVKAMTPEMFQALPDDVQMDLLGAMVVAALTPTPTKQQNND